LKDAGSANALAAKIPMSEVATHCIGLEPRWFLREARKTRDGKPGSQFYHFKDPLASASLSTLRCMVYSRP
jgi:hypothetical protein